MILWKTILCSIYHDIVSKLAIRYTIQHNKLYIRQINLNKNYIICIHQPLSKK